MKILTAFVRPEKLNDVTVHLSGIGVTGISVTTIIGRGRQDGYLESYRGIEHQITLIPKVRIEIVLGNDLVEKASSAIIKAAKTGHVGDGLIVISPVEDSIRIRTEERGEDAI